MVKTFLKSYIGQNYDILHLTYHQIKQEHGLNALDRSNY